MIRPRTAGELVELLEAGRINEIDPVWIKETYEISSASVLMMMPTPMEIIKKNAFWAWMVFADTLVLLYPEIVTPEWADYLIDEQERFTVWGVGI